LEGGAIFFSHFRSFGDTKEGYTITKLEFSWEVHIFWQSFKNKCHFIVKMKILPLLYCAALLGCEALPTSGPIAKSAPVPSGQPSNYADTIHSARHFVIEEEVVNVGKDYDISVNGKQVATISGKNFRGPFSGDAFVLKTLDGKVLATEKEEKRWLRLNRAASIYDGQGSLTGYLGEEVWNDLFSAGYIFHFYGPQKTEQGASQKIGRGAIDWHEIKDGQGRVVYEIDHKFSLIGDEYTLTVKNPSTAIPIEHALFLVCIEDAIKDAHTKKKK